MSDEKKDRKQAVYQIVPRPDEALWRQSVTVFAKPSRTTENGQFEPGEVFTLEPNGIGQYVVPANHPRYEACIAAMTNKMARENHEGLPPRIIGPFETMQKAMDEMGKRRPRTDVESAAEARAQLTVADGTISELKRKIAELESQKVK